MVGIQRWGESVSGTGKEAKKNFLDAINMFDWLQKTIRLDPVSRGFHLITGQVVDEVPELGDFEIGFLQVFIQHTSASLTINENADPDVRVDMESAANRLCPESTPFSHTCEGPDDMPAHVKASLFGSQLMIPIRAGKLALGTWQGIYLCEHRDRGGSRRLVLTVMGRKMV
jgi:secondary thiamine-phosphate synthase enzyme